MLKVERLSRSGGDFKIFCSPLRKDTGIKPTLHGSERQQNWRPQSGRQKLAGITSSAEAERTAEAKAASSLTRGLAAPKRSRRRIE
jgi:cysteine sulfinate desulfinase/cysteine desulfurase-like protein